MRQQAVSQEKGRGPESPRRTMRQRALRLAAKGGIAAAAVTLSLHTSYGALGVDKGRSSEIAPEPAAVDPAYPKYEALGEYFAKRYRVSADAATEFVSTAHSVGREIGIDPLVILAVMAVESRFNPIAQSGMGAKGLMQVMPQYHREKFARYGGTEAAFEQEANITVGAQIIKEYLVRSRTLTGALQLYAGASDDPDTAYANRVLAEKARLTLVVRQFEASNRTARAGASSTAG